MYQIAATDPDVGDTIRYELVYSSVNTAYFPQATVDAVTGTMRMFTGPCGGGGCDFGPMPFIVAAVDSTGARTEQGFVVDVTTQSRTVPAVVGLDVDAAKAARRRRAARFARGRGVRYARAGHRRRPESACRNRRGAQFHGRAGRIEGA